MRVFTDPRFSLLKPPTLGQIITDAFNKVVFALFDAASKNPALTTVAKWATILLALLFVARIVYLFILNSKQITFSQSVKRAQKHNKDLWKAAEMLAAEAQYADASHALYGAIIQTLNDQGKIVLHDSKTAGDYSRDLIRSGFKDIQSNFLQFVRPFQLVVFGLRRCDKDTFERLRTLARNTVGAS